MSMSRSELGRFGEAVAERLLVSHRYQILARNWRAKRGELDLVARRANTVVFVEVKTRRIGGPYPPEEAVNWTKMGRLRKAAAAYLAEHLRMRRLFARFDVVSVTVDHLDRVVEVRHLEDAF